MHFRVKNKYSVVLNQSTHTHTHTHTHTYSRRSWKLRRLCFVAQLLLLFFIQNSQGLFSMSVEEQNTRTLWPYVQCSAVHCAVLCCVMQCCAVLYNPVQCSAVLCCSVLCSAVLCCAVQCSAVQCSEVQCSAMQCNAVLCCTVLCSVVLCSAVAVLCCAVTVLCSTVLCSVVQCCAVLYSPVQCCTLLCSALLWHAVLCCAVLCCATPVYLLMHSSLQYKEFIWARFPHPLMMQFCCDWFIDILYETGVGVVRTWKVTRETWLKWIEPDCNWNVWTVYPAHYESRYKVLVQSVLSSSLAHNTSRLGTGVTLLSAFTVGETWWGYHSHIIL